MLPTDNFSDIMSIDFILVTPYGGVLMVQETGYGLQILARRNTDGRLHNI